MRLIVVRHGETKENVLGISQGHKYGELSETGIEQSKKLAQRLKNEKIDLIFSSDLKRAKDTTKEIIKYHEVPVFYVKELRERCRGIFEGKPLEEFDEDREKSGLPHSLYKPEGGESLEEVKERIFSFLKNLIENYKNKTILIVGHGGVNKIIFSILLSKPIEDIFNTINQNNACINILEIENLGKIKTHLINSIDHLEN